ncbi:hypothetical protein JCM10207_004693 [Rhodosporidiobolus poonsookiae]
MAVTLRHGTHTLADGTTLDYCLHTPAAPPPQPKAALVAHPWGRLGGRKEDHVVVALADTLADEGWTVVRYDARGAGQSGGSASWTGAAEAADYQELVDKLVLPLLLPAESSAAPPASPSAPAKPGSNDLTAQLLLCGYSFGSLAASSCPPPSPPDVTLHTSYLLVSYPLSVLWALCFLRSSPFTAALTDRLRTGTERVLAVFGDADQFSAVGKLRKWAQGLEKEAGREGCWQAVEVEGADHFWLDREKKLRLLETVQSWLREGEAS